MKLSLALFLAAAAVGSSAHDPFADEYEELDMELLLDGTTNASKLLLHANSTSHCGTTEPTDEEAEIMGLAFAQWKEANGGHHDGDGEHRALMRNVYSIAYTIPVYLHILACDDVYGQLDDRRRIRLMNILNRDFSKSPFQFELAGYQTIVNRRWCRCYYGWEYRHELRVNGTDVLNVYMCDTNYYRQGLVGMASFPPEVMYYGGYYDGVLLMNPALSQMPDDLIYHVFTHEVGHWLGLAHTFQHGCSPYKRPLLYGYPSYYFAGDGVKDTPAHRYPSAWYWGGDDCWRSFIYPLDTCWPPEAGVDDGVDPIDNYMNYISGFCMEHYGEFTKGQKERMLAEFETFRYQPAPPVMAPPTGPPTMATMIETEQPTKKKGMMRRRRRN